MNLRNPFLQLVAATAIAGAAWGAAELAPNSPDPWLWLTDIHGARPLAWAKAQNAKSFAALQADPEYRRDHDAILKLLNAEDRIPMPEIENGVVFNFWQDAAHVRGLWRRTTAAGYAQAQPHWDVLLDVDGLDATERKPWVWQGAQCAPNMKRCLVRLSPGGGDASAVREYDVVKKAFVIGGFSLPVAKSDTAWVDDDTILVGSDFGPGSMTTSGYPRFVRMWHRGQALSAAKTIFAGKTSDVASRPTTFHGPYGIVPLVERGLTFFTSEFYFVTPDGRTVQLPLPPGANVKGVTGGNLIFTLRDDWTPKGGRPIAKGSLVAFPVVAFVKGNASPAYTVLATPDARGAIEDVAPGRDAIYASIFENVTGKIHEFRPGAGGAWTHTILDLPLGGSTHIADADAWT
ncbi:MAG TPA: hypothetical protein VG274_05205, partial [Rhizomicrobium sp.]|nr:hypothetical protein [Rhizomicrobium sp.]